MKADFARAPQCLLDGQHLRVLNGQNPPGAIASWNKLEPGVSSGQCPPGAPAYSFRKRAPQNIPLTESPVRDQVTDKKRLVGRQDPKLKATYNKLSKHRTGQDRCLPL